MLEQTKCPECGTEVKIENYNDGNCPECDMRYSWKPVGTANAEYEDGPHDYINWRRIDSK